MGVEFIKWMCGKAEGFEYRKYSTTDHRINWVMFDGINDDYFCLIESRMMELYYSLLLQRAIEGINRDHRNFSDRCPVIHIECYWIEVIGQKMDEEYAEGFDIGSFDSIDKAKEAALRYIYEQEIAR